MAMGLTTIVVLLTVACLFALVIGVVAVVLLADPGRRRPPE